MTVPVLDLTPLKMYFCLLEFSEYLAKNLEDISEEYSLRLKIRENDVADLVIFPDPKLKKKKKGVFQKINRLEKDKHYKFYLQAQVNEFDKKDSLPLDFHCLKVTDLNDKKAKAKSSEPSAKDFIN